MNALSRLAVLGVSLLVPVAAVHAQGLSVSVPGRSDGQRVAAVARLDVGGIQGIVLDDRGVPLDGAMVSALGRTAAFAVTDGSGRFLLRPLPPGAYLIRAHLGGYLPSRARLVEVAPEGRAVSTIALRKAGLRRAVGTSGQSEEPSILAAGIGPGSTSSPPAEDEVAVDDHSERAWRLKHIPRSVLKDTDAPGGISDPDDLDVGGPSGEPSLIGRAMDSSIRLASNLFNDLPFSGQVNLLTTGAFDSPLQLMNADGMSHNVAYLSIGAPAGTDAEWTVRAAMTQGDVASWILSGSYVTTRSARHAYALDLSYSAQRYDGGNPAALAAVTDGARNVGAVYAYDRWTVSRAVTLGYGARYAKYDYIDGGLFSPRLDATVSPYARLRIDATVSRRLMAPGAEEFAPSTSGLWLPPERTFSTLNPAWSFAPERSNHYELALEHDVTASSVVGFRTFVQQVDDQLVTVFGARRPDQAPSDLGHYQVGTAGDVDARGWGLSYSQTVARRLRGTVDYTVTSATWFRSGDPTAIAVWIPSTILRDRERLHDLTTSVHADIPETSTRVFLLYRFNNGYARGEAAEGAGLDARFDFQVNQALPFLNFTSTEWEMLVAVRNLFRDPLADGSVYDELLVIRPPKRIVGGLLVRF